MTLNIKSVVVIAGEVPTVDIIDVSISIIIHTIAGYLTRISPDIAIEIWMHTINSSITNGNHNSLTHIPSTPSLRSTDTI